MRARRGSNRFKQREVARMLRAVTDAGAAAEKVEVDPATGKISVTLRNKDSAPADGENPWLDDLNNKVPKR